MNSLETPDPESSFTGPYRGLEPFDESAAAFFFGRESEIQLTMASLFASPLTLLYGVSGVGKSSVLRAGVLPEIRKRTDLLPVVYPRLGRTPSGSSFVERGWDTDPVSGIKETMALALFSSAGGEKALEGKYRDKVFEHDMSPLRIFSEACAEVSSRRVMVILDQFEEYLLYHPEDDLFAAQFPDAVVGRDRTVSFLLSLREDALAKLDRFKSRIPTLWDSYRRIEHLSREAAADAIRLPLEEYNRPQPPGETPITVEATLVDDVLRDVQADIVQFEGLGSGSLRSKSGASPGIETPYLQLVLTRLWERERAEGSHVLRWSTLRAEGGAPVIVRTHLDRVMEQFLPEERDIAARVFHRLVTPSGAKIAISIGDLAEYEGIPQEVLAPILQRLEASSRRVLRRVAGPGLPEDKPRYEIFHDRLGAAILAWRSKRLRAQASAPTSRVAIDREEPGEARSQPGVALCLGGGGYKALLFHVGAILRLNEASLLRRLVRISTVSAGSIAGAFLGFKWHKLTFYEDVAINLTEEFLSPLLELAGHTVDLEKVMLRVMLRAKLAMDSLSKHFDQHLFGGGTLQDLPVVGEGPEIMIVATNVQSGAIWRFSRAYMGDYRVGKVRQPNFSLASAVAASSALPPALSPFVLDLKQSELVPDAGSDLGHAPFTTEIQLTDGSVADRLALETAWRRYSTILISDGGGRLFPQGEPRQDLLGHSMRVMELIDDQLRSLRKRQVIESFQTGAKRGAYWGLWTDIADYGLADALPCPKEAMIQLAQVPTRLKKLEPELKSKLVNWGYAVCDAAIRRHLAPDLKPPTGFPFPANW